MSFEDNSIVPLPTTLGTWRFYEPLLLLYSLKSVLPRDNSTHPSDLEGIADKDPREAFFCFVNKLSQVCDSEHGGKTVTAFGVLQTGSVEYRFASNDRDSQSLAEVRRYVMDLLETLGHAPDAAFQDSSQRAALTTRILGKILGFNRPRIEVYLGRLLRHFDFCIKGCHADGTTDVANRSNELLRAISLLYDDDRFRNFMRKKTREDREKPNDSPWSELYHSLGRLHSYSVATKVFLCARGRWPELFEAFDVNYIPSSKSSSHTPSVRRSAARMLERLTKDPDVLNAYYEEAERLQGLGLDKKIKENAKPRKFAPIIHAEVNLCDNILREERSPHGEGRVRFFNESVFGRYIGSSKPTCRLCDLYFHAPSGPNIEVRKSHQNLYYNWRAPDVYRQDGPAADQARKAILESMIASIKHQVMKTIVDRFTVGKRHDSNTTTSYPFSMTFYYGAESARARDGMSSIREAGGDSGNGERAVPSEVTVQAVDDLASTLGQIDIGSESGRSD
ncbi:hypothetical protein MMYC01_206074 [Madurella mycetomatis]|uniref:Uncharacterized protein n=1 Tax=Madurella mycetomatis TaxID=100816 RepID=A0A175W1T6_9PEZI|nr:hypothetical protein MMYC01_206074 [Madurella mycetomatis]